MVSKSAGQLAFGSTIVTRRSGPASPAAENVEMQVPHRLAGVVAVVHDQPEVVGVSGFLRHYPGGLKKLSPEGLVLQFG